MTEFIADQITVPRLGRSDDHLLKLVTRYIELERQSAEHQHVLEALQSLIKKKCPPPEAFGRMPSELAAGRVAPRKIQSWALRSWEAFGAPGLGFLSPAFKTAIDQYEDQISAAYDEIGFGLALKREEELTAAEGEVLDEIQTTPARTIEGVVAKLRVMGIVEKCMDAGDDDDYWLQWKGDMLRDARRLADTAMSIGR